jgi:hypothetical protein
MKLAELREQWLTFVRALWEDAKANLPPPQEGIISRVSINASNPPLELAILKAIEECDEVAELEAFVDLDEVFELPLQARFNALERWLELGGRPQEALRHFQFTHGLYPLNYPEEIQLELYATLTQLESEHAPPEAYEQLRATTVERIRQLRREGIYALDPPGHVPPIETTTLTVAATITVLKKNENTP